MRQMATRCAPASHLCIHLDLLRSSREGPQGVGNDFRGFHNFRFRELSGIIV